MSIRRGSPRTTQPEGDAASGRIAELIAQLGSNEFKEREKAQKGLVGIGPLALQALKVAAGNNDAERAARAKLAIAAIDQEQRRLALRKKGRICLYLLAGTANTPEVLPVGLENLRLRGEPLLRDADFVSYDAMRNELRLTAEARAKLPKNVDLNGVPFVLVVDGRRWFLGSFYNPISSDMPPVPTTTVPLDKEIGDGGISTPAIKAQTDESISRTLRGLSAPAVQPGSPQATQPAKSHAGGEEASIQSRQ